MKFSIFFVVVIIGGGHCSTQLFTYDESMTDQTRQPSQGESVTLQCVISSAVTEPVTVIDWTKDSNSISDLQQTTSLVYTSTDTSLTIPSYSYGYDGYYQCVARLEGNETTVTQVSPPILLSSFESRPFTSQPVNHTARINPDDIPPYSYEALAFTCTLSKTYRGPKPIITWQVIEPNGVVNNFTDFSDGSGRDIIIQYDHTGYYQRHNPTMADSGMLVRCLAINSESQDEVIYSNWATANITTEAAVPNQYELFSMEPPEDYHLFPGQNITTFPCVIADGRQGDDFNLVWYAGGGILFSNGISHSSIDGISLFGPTSLQIDFNEISFPRSTFMAVEYVCQTRYSGRDYRASVSILDPAPEIQPPSVNHQSSPIQTVDIDTTKQLTFSTPAMPYITRLWFNGGLIDDMQKYSIDQTSSSVTVVTIHNATVKDSGLYQLEVISGTQLDYSVDMYTFEVIVRVEIATDQLCGFSGQVVPNVTVPYTCSPSLPSTVQLHSTGQLEIDPDITNGVSYTCSSGVLMFILEIDVIVSTYSNANDAVVTADVGSNVILTCATINKPIIKYSWTKDGTFLEETIMNALAINNVSFNSIGQYRCSIIITDTCTVTPSATTQLNIKLPQVEVDSLVDNTVSIAPQVVVGGYNCTPLVSFGELNSMGELIVPAGVDTAIDGEYTCTSHDLNGVFVFNLKAIAKAYITSFSSGPLYTSVGDVIDLNCMAQGIPGTITYNWYRNGVLVSTTDTVGSYSLVVDVNSIGVYECVPVNIHGTHNTSSVLVNVKVNHGVNILDVYRNLTTSSSVLAPATPSGYNCGLIPNGEIMASGHLVIMGSPSAVGSYNCTSSDVNGTFTVELTALAEAYVTDSISSPLIINRGESVTLWCSAKAAPATNTQCLWNGSPYNVSSSTNEDFNCTYDIHDMLVSDVGMYECSPVATLGNYNSSIITVGIRVHATLNTLVTNSIAGIARATNTDYNCIPPMPDDIILYNNGSLHSFPGILQSSSSDEYVCTSSEFNGSVVIRLSVIAPAYVETSNPLEIKVVDVSDTAVITCPANGIPNDIIYTWTKNGVELVGQNTSTLSILSFSGNDIGHYECIPSNSRGTYNTSRTILQARLDNTGVSALDGHNSSIAPAVSSGYVCDPPLPNGELTNGGYLILSPVLTVNDSKEYTCSSADLNGSFVIDLRVYSPAYVTSTRDQFMEANLGSTVTMSCPAKGIPNSITYVWKKNDQMIEGETGSELTIDRMTVAGSGVYQCIPYNVHGNHNSTSIQVIVKVVESYDWLTPYNIPGKFPPSVVGYSCLPTLSERLDINTNGDFVTSGLLLEDDQIYICNAIQLQVSFVFHVQVKGYVPHAVHLHEPVFIDEGRAINISWHGHITRITPVDRFVLSWRIQTDDHNEEKRERQAITTQNTWYSLTNYTLDTTYFFSVIAENRAGSSEPSNEVSLEIGPVNPFVQGRNNKDGGGLKIWIIILIAVCSAITLLICCLCCFFCLLCCLGERQKVYHAEEEEAKNAEEFARYRKKGEENGETIDGDDVSDMDSDISSITSNDATD